MATGLAAALILAGGAAQAEDLDFLLANESDVGIIGFYVSDVNDSNWQQNLMAGGVLAPGYEIDVLIADGLTTCVYDIRTEFEDGETLEDYELDLCEMGSYTFE